MYVSSSIHFHPKFLRWSCIALWPNIFFPSLFSTHGLVQTTKRPGTTHVRWASGSRRGGELLGAELLRQGAHGPRFFLAKLLTTSSVCFIHLALEHMIDNVSFFRSEYDWTKASFSHWAVLDYMFSYFTYCIILTAEIYIMWYESLYMSIVKDSHVSQPLGRPTRDVAALTSTLQTSLTLLTVFCVFMCKSFNKNIFIPF